MSSTRIDLGMLRRDSTADRSGDSRHIEMIINKYVIGLRCFKKTKFVQQFIDANTLRCKSFQLTGQLYGGF